MVPAGYGTQGLDWGACAGWRIPSGSQRRLFQLHPNGYRFEAGHLARPQLLPADIPYSRPTNGQLPVSFSDLELRLPVSRKPGTAGGSVKRTAPKFLPPGYELARGYRR